MNNLATAARAFIEAVYAKLEVDETQFYGDSEIDKAYASLIRVIKRGVPADVQWSWGVFEFCMGFGDAIRDKRPKLEPTVDLFIRRLEGLLAHVSTIEWLACVPLERVFCRFPDYTDFGSFAILNPAGTANESTDGLLASFRTLLTNHFDVNFAIPEDPYHNESYLRLGEHYLNKSGHYLPGRPMIVAKLGRGEERSNEKQLKSKLNEILPLFQVCQLALSLTWTLSDRVIGPHSTLPDGKWMDDGLILVPPVAVGINKSNGDCGWWSSGFNLYETQAGAGYEPERFLSVWREIAEPVIEFRELAGANKCRLAVDNAIRLMSRCRHEELGDSTVNAVIATETILSPFNQGGDIKERFALMTSALSESDAVGRRRKYQQAKELYNYRCEAVHRSRFFSEERQDEELDMAVRLFLTSLNAIVNWGSGILKRGEKLDQSALDAFFLSSVIR